MRSFNPFNDLYANESSQHLHARTLRTSFWQKMSDTFFVLAGHEKINNDESSSHVGFFDYATLLIPYALNYLLRQSVDSLSRSEMSYSVIFEIPVNIIYHLCKLICDIPRYTLSAIFTLIASPIVLLVHAASSIASYSLKEAVNKLTVNMKEPTSTSSHVEMNRSFGDLLTAHNLALDDVNVFHKSDGIAGFDMLEIRKNNAPIFDGEYLNYIPMTEQFVDENKASFDAMLKLNVGGFARLFNRIPCQKFKDKFPEESDTSFNMNNTI